MEQTWKVTVFFLRSYITDNCRKIRYKLSKDDCDGTRCPEATVFWWLLAIKTPYDNWELGWRPILSELGPKSWMRLDLHSCSNLGSLYFLPLQCFHLSQVDLGFNAALPQGNVNTSTFCIPWSWCEWRDYVRQAVIWAMLSQKNHSRLTPMTYAKIIFQVTKVIDLEEVKTNPTTSSKQKHFQKVTDLLWTWNILKKIKLIFKITFKKI